MAELSFFDYNASFGYPAAGVFGLIPTMPSDAWWWPTSAMTRSAPSSGRTRSACSRDGAGRVECHVVRCCVAADEGCGRPSPGKQRAPRLLLGAGRSIGGVQGPRCVRSGLEGVVSYDGERMAQPVPDAGTYPLLSHGGSGRCVNVW